MASVVLVDHRHESQGEPNTSGKDERAFVVFGKRVERKDSGNATAINNKRGGGEHVSPAKGWG